MEGLCGGEICVEERKEGQGTPFDPAGCKQGRGERQPRVHVWSRSLPICLVPLT